MSARDITVVKSPGDIRTYQTDDRNTSGSANALEPGEPIQVLAVGSPYAITLYDGGPIRGSDEFLGIVAKTSTETATANGLVDYISIIPGETILRGKATTTSNINTAAKILAYQGNWIGFDNTAEVFTIDEDETDDPNKLALKVITGDSIAFSLDVLVNAANVEAGIWTGQTVD